MKKTLAALSASVLGIGGALFAASAPANAVLPSCTDATDHQIDPALADEGDWYMTCVPQYGMGKAEYTITTDAEHPFPSDYNLASATQAVTSTPTSAQVKTYFEPLWEQTGGAAGAAVYRGAFMNPARSAATATSQTYGGGTASPSQTVAYPIVSVGPATTLPAGCTPTSDPTAAYDGRYVVTYGPTTTTFKQTLDNVVRTVTVTFTPAPLYLGLNFTAAPDATFDSTRPICASSAGQTTFSPSDSGSTTDSDNFIWAAFVAATASPVGGPETLDPNATPPDFSGGSAPSLALGSFVATSTPVLATTGVDPAPAGALGLGFVGAGALATGFEIVRRRRRAIVR